MVWGDIAKLYQRYLMLKSFQISGNTAPTLLRYNNFVGYYMATNQENRRKKNAPISRKGRLYWWERGT